MGEDSRADTRLATDTVVDILGDRHRRDLLTLLMERGDSIEIDTAVTYLHAQEASREGAGTSRDRLATKLHHTHLRKLEAAGVISIDETTNEIRYHRCEQVERLLRVISRD